MATCDTDVAASVFGNTSVLVPAVPSPMSHVRSRPAVAIHLGANIATFVSGTFSASTRLVLGDSPSYQQLIPKANENHLTVVAADLVESITV